MKRPPLSAYIEACAALAKARITLLAQPTKAHFASAISGKVAAPDDRAMVRRTVRAAARRLPFRTECYEQAMAARAMLKRRKLASRLHFGTGKSQGDLTAHVWLTSGDHVVIGEEEAAHHVELARSPEPEA